METNLSAVFRDDQSMSLHNPEVIWSILNDGPHLLEALAEREPLIRSICDRLAETLPCQRVWGFGETGAFHVSGR